MTPLERLELYKRLIEPLRVVARRLGYALVVHGSMLRDLDLVAVPWVEDGVVPAKTLAKAIQHKARELTGYAEPDPLEARSINPKWFRDGLMGYCPMNGRLICGKSHGRRCWAYWLTPDRGGPYIDLSVMPRLRNG